MLRFSVRMLPVFYKRNPISFICKTIYTFSTNKYNPYNMEPTEDITKKIQEIKIQNKEGEAKEIKKEEKVVKEEFKLQKKEKKKKEEKPKKEEIPTEVNPKMFSMIDMRVSEIVDCWKHPESQNLYCEKILVCGQVRQIASGLQKFVPIQMMKGKVIVMANLKPRPLAGFVSNGMVVCASNDDHSKVQLLIPEGQLGERIYLQGFQDLFEQKDLQPVLNPKKKILEKCLEFLKTDNEGFVTWKDIKLRTKAGFLKAATINNGKVS